MHPSILLTQNAIDKIIDAATGGKGATASASKLVNRCSTEFLLPLSSEAADLCSQEGKKLMRQRHVSLAVEVSVGIN